MRLGSSIEDPDYGEIELRYDTTNVPEVESVISKYQGLFHDLNFFEELDPDEKNEARTKLALCLHFYFGLPRSKDDCLRRTEAWIDLLDPSKENNGIGARKLWLFYSIISVSLRTMKQEDYESIARPGTSSEIRIAMEKPADCEQVLYVYELEQLAGGNMQIPPSTMEAFYQIFKVMNVYILNEPATFLPCKNSIYRRWTLQINNLRQFGEIISEFEEAGTKVPIAFSKLLDDYNPENDLAFEEYLLQRLEEVKRGPILEHGEHKRGDCTVTSDQSEREMEGTQKLDFSFRGLIDREGNPILPVFHGSSVRYGQISDTEAKIYNVQEARVFGQAYQQSKNTVKLYINSRNRILEEYPDDVIDGRVDHQSLLNASWLNPELNEYMDFFRTISLAEAALREFNWRRQMNSEVTAILRKGIPRDAGAIRSAHAHGIMSLIECTMLMHEKGIRKIYLSKEAPFRAHLGQQGLSNDSDERIRRSKVALAQRLAHEVKGVQVELESYERPNDIVITLDENIELSDNSNLNQVLRS